MSSQNDIVQEGKLLSEQERVAFKMISTGNDLHGQRAIALLAIDGGATQAEAGRQADLTPRAHDAVSACPVRSRPKVAVNPEPFHSWRPAT